MIKEKAVKFLKVKWRDIAIVVLLIHLTVGTGIPLLAEIATVQPPPALDSLTDVNVPTPSDDDVLSWDSGGSEWVDRAIGESMWEIDGSETQLITADELDIQSHKIINVTDPTSVQDAATKKYVDDNAGVATSGTPEALDFARFTHANIIEGLTYAETKTALSLDNVENTAHSTNPHTMTLDGRDVSVDGTKLDTIATNADVTGSNAPQAHAASHTDGTDDIQDASDTNKGIARFDAQHFTVTAGDVDLKIDGTPVSGETDEPITSNWAFDHNAAVLSTTVHNNDNYFIGNYQATIVDPTTAEHIRLRNLVAIEDPSSALDDSDWYGASGAYTQADADSTSTKIEKNNAAFPASMQDTLVYWASNAVGDADTGVGLVDTVTDADTLTIKKFTGADFAANYYFWIKHDEWVVPVTGIYLVVASCTYYPVEVGKSYITYIGKFTGTNEYTSILQQLYSCANAYYEIITLTAIKDFTAGDHVLTYTYHTGTTGTPDIYYANTGHNTLQIFLLKQTA